MRWLLVLGAVLVAAPCVTIDANHRFSTHLPNPPILVVLGSVLLAFSMLAFGFTLWSKHASQNSTGADVDLRRVRQQDGAMWTSINGCEIRVLYGRIQDYSPSERAVIVLPCNEYFDDECAEDTKSALGAYVNSKFDGRVADFASLVTREAGSKLGCGNLTQKTTAKQARSFGPGRCLLLRQPLGHPIPIALISTATQRAGEGLATRISYLFDGIRELFTIMADARVTEVTMPVLGSGHGRLDPPLAFVGLVLAIAEAARYGRGGQRLRRISIIVFRSGNDSAGTISDVTIRQTLALVGSPD